MPIIDMGAEFSKFGLKSNIEDAIKTATQDFNIKMLDIDKIEPSKDNFYKMSQIEELKDSLKTYGIQQNLVVMNLKNGRYELLSGHRRHYAAKQLVAEGEEKFKNLPCRVMPPMPESLKKILIITTNKDVRNKTDWEKTSEIYEFNESVKEYRKENDLKGSTRAVVAKELDYSDSVIGRHLNIARNLVAELMELYKNGELKFSNADYIAGFPPDRQRKLMTAIEGELTTSKIQEYILSQKPQKQEPILQPETLPALIKEPNEKELENSGKVGMVDKYEEITLTLPKYLKTTIIIIYTKQPDIDGYRIGYKYKTRTGGGICTPPGTKPYQTIEEAKQSVISSLYDNWNLTKVLTECKDSWVQDIIATIPKADEQTTTDFTNEPPEPQEKDWQNITPCERCKTSHPSCDKCCHECNEHCNGRQTCYLGYDKPIEPGTNDFNEVIDNNIRRDAYIELYRHLQGRIKMYASFAPTKVEVYGEVLEFVQAKLYELTHDKKYKLNQALN